MNRYGLILLPLFDNYLIIPYLLWFKHIALDYKALYSLYV